MARLIDKTLSKFVNSIMGRFKTPLQVVLDNRPSFTKGLLDDMFTLYDILKNQSYGIRCQIEHWGPFTSLSRNLCI